AGQLERGHRVGGLVADPPGHVGELAALPPEAGSHLGDLVGLEVEDLAEGGRRGLRILDEARVGPDGALGDADREVVAVAVEDRAAVGGQGDLLEPLGGAEGGVLVAAERLEVDEPRGDRGEAGEERDESDGEAATGPARSPDQPGGGHAGADRAGVAPGPPLGPAGRGPVGAPADRPAGRGHAPLAGSGAWGGTRGGAPAAAGSARRSRRGHGASASSSGLIVDQVLWGAASGSSATGSAVPRSSAEGAAG